MIVSRGPSGLGGWFTSLLAPPPPPPPPPAAKLPVLTVAGGAPSAPIMQVATTYASDPSLPPNIQAGGCSQLLPGFYIGAGNYIYAQDGTNTGDWISPDNMRLFSSGLPLCHDGSAYQDLGAATVLSIPDDLRGVLRNCGISSDSLRTWESQAQDLCVQSQRLTAWDADTGANLGQLWQQAEDILNSATATVANADAAFAQFKAADDAVKGAYSNGTYANSNDGAFVMRVLTDYNHTALAWPNIQAAAQCVHDEFFDWCQTIASDFGSRYIAMTKQAAAVSAAFEDVQALVQQLTNDSNDVGGMTPAQSDAVNKAAPYLKQLTDLASQIAAVFSEASSWDGRVTNAIAADPPDFQTLLDADAWVRTAQQPFLDAPQRAGDLASQVHQLLDGPAQDLHTYLVQHPELVGTGGKPKTKGNGGKIIAGVGAVGVLALLVKKGIIFG